jgi:mRNA interferase MazF
MTVFKRGDVVLVAFPFTDLTTTKMRPALILSSDAFNQSHLDIILVAVTSQVSKKVPRYDYLLTPEDQHCAGLPKPSLVKLGKIVTIDQRLIRKKLGHIPNPTLGYLTTELHKILS